MYLTQYIHYSRILDEIAAEEGIGARRHRKIPLREAMKRKVLLRKNLTGSVSLCICGHFPGGQRARSEKKGRGPKTPPG